MSPDSQRCHKTYVRINPLREAGNPRAEHMAVKLPTTAPLLIRSPKNVCVSVENLQKKITRLWICLKVTCKVQPGSLQCMVNVVLTLQLTGASRLNDTP